MFTDLEQCTGRQVLEAARASVSTRREAEVQEMRVASQWAAIHGEPQDDRDPMTAPGGEGTPPVRVYSLPELAMARETHTLRPTP